MFLQWNIGLMRARSCAWGLLAFVAYRADRVARRTAKQMNARDSSNRLTLWTIINGKIWRLRLSSDRQQMSNRFMPFMDFCTELEDSARAGRRPSLATHQAMTMTNTSPSAARTKQVKFTPEAIEKIKELVAQGASREEIASLLGATVGSLQVTCSRLGISLRRKILHSGPTPHLRDPKGRVIPAQGSVGVAYEQEQTAAEVLPARSAKISIIMRYRGKEVSTDLPLTSHALGELALIAMLRDLSIPELVGQILAGAIENDMIKEILRGEAGSHAGLVGSPAARRASAYCR